MTLVAVAKNHINIAEFFCVVSYLITVVRSSCRSGQGLNQETNLKRPGDTRWGSYYGTILNLILMFSAVVDVLEIIEESQMSCQ